MKNIMLLSAFLLALALCPVHLLAQPGYITTIAGNGTYGLGANGVPATATPTGQLSAIFADVAGNIYFKDSNSVERIRRINTAGFVSTFAGGGSSTADGIPATSARISAVGGMITQDLSGNIVFVDKHRIRKINVTTGIITTMAGILTAGYSGDGGAATAAQLNKPIGICFDQGGNLYIGDGENNRIRKVDPSGNISTFAGTGSSGYSGDGGPATAAKLKYPGGICIDNSGNLYIADRSNNRVRKVDVAGVITTYAGSGSGAFSGDGGAATTAGIYYPTYVSIDNYYNLYLIDYSRVRKVGSNGIINTVAGGGSLLGSGIPATTADLNFIQGLCNDNYGNVYASDYYHSRICKISSSGAVADSFLVTTNNLCSGAEFTVATMGHATSYNQTTNFGDGNTFTSVVPPATGGSPGLSPFSHTYSLPGTYTIKTTFSNGTAVLDSATYTYEYRMCNILQAKFYIDNNSSMAYEAASDNLSYYPHTIEIDSNGVHIDTVVATSGFYYTAYGTPGDIYKLKIINLVPGLSPSAPLLGTLYDTLQAGTAISEINYFGLTCSSVPGNNLRIHSANRCGSHKYGGELLVDNLYCNPGGSASVTLSISPKYQYQSANPTPTSVSGNTLTWNLTGLSTTSAPIHIQITGEKPSATSPYLPGDTVHSYGVIFPWTGDTDTTDNVTNPVDTVKSGYDPNFIDVTPKGYIPSGTQLEYTIGFENTGNDTAYNIYILDTLSDDLDPSTLNIVTASAAMDIYRFTAGGHTILKFDFPHINLLDSSYHNLCHGMVIYTIKTRNGLPDCTHIPNRAGIYFDLNPVVMTNTIENIIGPPPAMAALSGSNEVCLAGTTTIAASLPGGTWSTSNSNASVAGGVVTGNTNGLVFVYYSLPAACGPVVSQYLISVGAPMPAYITSPGLLCEGTSFTVSATVGGGAWSTAGANISLMGSTLVGINAGIDTLYYTITSACGSTTTPQVVQVDPIVIPAAISGISTLCEGTTVTLGNATLGGVWSFSNANASISASGVLTGVTAGTGTAYYTVTNACGSHASSMPITIQPAANCGSTNVQAISESDNTVQVFPNPASNRITIMMADNAYSSVTIANNVGQALITQNILTSITALDIHTLPPGLYYITLKGSNGNVVKKFVKL